MRAALVFKNEGVKAGARLAHPHSQVVAMPVVPPALAEELAGARPLLRASRPVRLLRAGRSGDWPPARGWSRRPTTRVVIAPYAARWPFETWLLPRVHHARFEQAPASLLAAVAAAPRSRCCGRIERRLEGPALNVVLHSAPYAEAGDAAYHWHLGDRPAGAAGVGLRSGQRHRGKPGVARGGRAGAARLRSERFRPAALPAVVARLLH